MAGVDWKELNTNTATLNVNFPRRPDTVVFWEVTSFPRLNELTIRPCEICVTQVDPQPPNNPVLFQTPGAVRREGCRGLPPPHPHPHPTPQIMIPLLPKVLILLIAITPYCWMRTPLVSAPPPPKKKRENPLQPLVGSGLNATCAYMYTHYSS